MIDRPSYIHSLKVFKDKPLIKILTGIRRSGKSTILQMFKNNLINEGVSDDQIIFINFESLRYTHLRSAHQLYKYIQDKIIQKNTRYYLFLDEIQEVDGWEKAVNSFMVDFNVDIYLTGSNSHMLSSELATYLTGRYIELSVYTLSFAEYLDFENHYKESIYDDTKELFAQYLELGGFPIVHIAEYDIESAYKVIYDIYSSIILRDTVQRYNIRDIELLDRVVRYALDNIGNTFSGKNIADFFKSQQRKVDVNTIYNYLHALEGAYILCRSSRYDLKGKEILKTQEKFYLSDPSLLYAVMGFSNRKISGILENIIYLELKRRGYNVFIGKLGNKEIDFIAEKQNDRLYIQVAYKLESETTVNREFNPLLSIKDQYPKYVVTMDEFWKESVQGVRHMYIADFLLGND